MTHHEHPNVALVREGFAAAMRGDMGWMEQYLADDVVWHVGGNSKWAGAYQGKQQVLEYFARQAQATGGPPSVDIHDVLGNNDHVVVLGTPPRPRGTGSSAEWKYTRSLLKMPGPVIAAIPVTGLETGQPATSALACVGGCDDA